MKPKSRENVLTPQERERFLGAIEEDDEELAAKGLFFTGMRVSEFTHMKKDWIDWKEGLIHIPYKMKCSCYECMAKKGSHKGYFICKTKQAERPIPILPEVKEMFLMFFTKNESIMDSLYNRVHVWELVKKVGERAKIGHKVFPHSLRATFVTILIEKGMDDPVALTQIMGWKKLDMASEYVRLSGASLKRKLEGIW